MTSTLNIVICGCTINSASYIQKYINNLLPLKNIFKSVDFIVYENDSEDNTVYVLKEMENNNLIKLITEHGIKEKYKNIRTKIIGHGRNKLVQFVTSSAKYDFMIMIILIHWKNLISVEL